jgi:hypothetical protein
MKRVSTNNTTYSSNLFQYLQLSAELAKGRHMSCDVVFGSPSANCMGTGVCKIMAVRSQEAATLYHHCRSALCLFSKRQDQEGVTLTFPREKMSLNLFRRHFRYGGLELTEACSLPRHLVSFLNLKITTLEPGWYPIEHGPGFFRIHF